MMMTRVVVLGALINAVEGGFCDSHVARETGYHCRGPLNGPDEQMCPYGQDGGGMYSQFCSCGWEMEVESGRRQLEGAESEQAGASEETRRVLQSSSSRRRSSSSRRRSGSHVELEYECEKVGEPRACADGCDPATGMCVQLSASQRCGSLPWEPATSTPATFNGVRQPAQTMPQLCPHQATQLSFENIMDSSFRISALLTETESNMRWFEALMTIDLYAPTDLTFTSTCTPTVPGSATDCQLSAEQLATSAACDAIGGDCTYTTGVAQPTGLSSIYSLSEYQAFACARNFPECESNQMVKQECITRCEAVSEKIAEFSAACQDLDNGATCRETAPMNGGASVAEDAAACAAVDATAATGEDDCLSVNLNTPVEGADAGACTYTPPAFQCHTLANLPGGYDASGVRLGNGCANTGTNINGTVVDRGTESWCHVPARPGATCVLCAQQGWERDCDHLCTEAAPSAAAAPNYKCHVPLKTAAATRVDRGLAVLGAVWSATAVLL